MFLKFGNYSASSIWNSHSWLFILGYPLMSHKGNAKNAALSFSPKMWMFTQYMHWYLAAWTQRRSDKMSQDRQLAPNCQSKRKLEVLLANFQEMLHTQKILARFVQCKRFKQNIQTSACLAMLHLPEPTTPRHIKSKRMRKSEQAHE